MTVPLAPASPTRVAAIDCGTNSLRLLVADVDPVAATLRDVDRRMEIVRLGQGVDATGRFAPEALDRALTVIGDYARRCADLGVEGLRFVATSATRDAADADRFVAAVRDLIGVDPEVITGEEEARLTFVGATRGLPGGLAGGPTDEVLVVDIGGGSTEFVLGEAASGRLDASISVDIGCVRLTERHSRVAAEGPVTDLVAIRAEAEQALDAAARVVPFARARALVGVAGSVTTITAHALALPAYLSERIHGAVLPVAQVIAACRELAALPRDRRAALPYLHPGRVDVIAAGAVVWQSVLERLREVAGLREVVTSEHDILDGIAWSLAGR